MNKTTEQLKSEFIIDFCTLENKSEMRERLDELLSYPKIPDNSTIEQIKQEAIKRLEQNYHLKLSQKNMVIKDLRAIEKVTMYAVMNY